MSDHAEHMAQMRKAMRPKAPRPKGAGRRPVITRTVRLGLARVVEHLDTVAVPLEHAEEYAAARHYLARLLAHHEATADRRKEAAEFTRQWRSEQ